MSQDVHIVEPCKTCGKPIGADIKYLDGKFERHYNDASGREHKKCLLKRVGKK